jgi:hypothetical protein
VKAERKQISKTPDFVGRVEAINRVDVRARVKGYTILARATMPNPNGALIDNQLMRERTQLGSEATTRAEPPGVSEAAE